MRLRLLTLLVIVCLLSSLPVQAQSGRYTFTLIADSNGPLNGFSSAALSNTGTVAFIAGRDAGGYGVFTGTGGSLNTIVDTTGAYGTFYYFWSATMNNSDVVAFDAHAPGSVNNVYKGSGGAITPIATGLGAVTGMAINDSGVVAFGATAPGRGYGVHVGSGGGLSTLDSGAGYYFSGPHYNNSGTALFGALYYQIGHGIFTRNPSATLRLFGAQYDVFATLNDQGAFAFLESQGLGSAVRDLYIESGGQQTPVAATSAGGYTPVGSFNNIGGFNINNSPAVIFLASVNNGGVHDPFWR